MWSALHILDSSPDILQACRDQYRAQIVEEHVSPSTACYGLGWSVDVGIGKEMLRQG